VIGEGGAAVSDTIVASHPTLASSWQPRSDAWLLRDPSPYAGRAGRPLFIGACPRSGTTLLRSMLNNHPDFAMPAETDFVIPVWLNRGRCGDLRDAANRRRLAQWILDTPGRGGRRIRAGVYGRDEAIERVVASPPTLGSIFASLFAMFAEAKGKRRWGDKRPAYAVYVNAIFALFPDAQFVNVVRDPRGAVASATKLGWYADETGSAVASATATWEASVRRVDEIARRLRPDQLLDVRYEDMVRDPAHTLRDLTGFCGLRGDDDTIEAMVTRPRRGVFEEGYHERLAEPISTAPIDDWRQRLEPHHVALIEHATHASMRRLGYEREASLAADPRPADLRALRVHRRNRDVKWRRYALGEAKRRLLGRRRPVAAQPGAAAV
jgi:sulfotransferase family protein